MITTLIIAALSSAVCTLGARQLARRYSIVAAPNPIVPQHREPVAYLGGLGLCGGLLCTFLFTGDWPSVAVLVGGGGMLGLGLLDDLIPFQPLYKLLAQTLIASAAVALGLGAWITGHFVLDDAIVCVLIVAWVNAVNLTDVCDGLVAALAAVGMGGLAVLNGFQDPLCLIVAAACLGFLVYNKPAASIYLGDAGSHLLGFLIAALTIEAFASGKGILADLAAVLCSSVFIFELLFLIVVRRSKGLPFWRGSPDHFSLRMQAGPFTRRQTVLTASLAAAVCAAIGWFLPQTSTLVASLLLLLLAVTAAWVSYKLLQWPVDAPKGDPR
jgi:UDP-GlcNAc:undecaprenyl-phosphate/decaprenyl-phosphate GlcNAc-1-phosphate transferase